MAYETGTYTTAKLLFDRIVAQLQSTGFMGSGNEWTKLCSYDGYTNGNGDVSEGIHYIFECPGPSGNGDWIVGIRLDPNSGTNTENIQILLAESGSIPSVGGSTLTYIGTWDPGSVSYSRGDVVLYSGEYYICDISHTSDATLPTALPATWQEVTDNNFLGGAFMNLVGSGVILYSKIWTSGTGDVKYWLVADENRLALVSKSSSRYHFVYAGGIDTPISAGSYPSPIMATKNSLSSTDLYSDSDNENFPMSDTLYSLKLPSGQYSVPSQNELWPYSGSAALVGMGINPAGDRALEPILLFASSSVINEPGFYGSPIGVFAIYNDGLTSEDIVTISSQDYLVVENVYRGSSDNFLALKLA